MPFREAKNADTVYADVADADLVLVPDAPFASAINRRLTRPHLGTFATTPRRYAAGRREHAEDRTAFLELVDTTEHDWRAIAYAIGNVLQCWEHQGACRSILEYPGYVDAVTHDVVEAFGSLPSTSASLGDARLESGGEVAVVGEAHLTALEREMLTPDATRVNLFTGGAVDLPPFHVFESKTDIVAALLDRMTADNAEHVAIVLDRSSQYSPLVESALEAAGIPYYGGPGFIDDPDHRGLIKAIRASYRGRETTVADVRALLTRIGEDVPIADHHKRLDAVDGPGIDWLNDFIANVDARTFGEALAVFEERIGRRLDAFKEELEALGLAETPITGERVDQLAYYLQTYEVPIDRSDEGVLLVDATSSAFVDRPVVFFLGLDEGWTHTPPQRPWIDPEAQFERNIGQFERLLQSGEHRYFLVQDTVGGEPVTPCLYFQDLLEEPFERFSDRQADHHRPRPRGVADGFERRSIGVSPRELETISQSSLNSYLNSPRDYFFGRVLDGPDRDYFLEGTLFHDFAEFFVAHPTFAQSLDLDRVTELMLEEARPFIPKAELGLRRARYRLGLEHLVEYLEGHLPETDGFLPPSEGWGTNFFAEHFDRPIASPLTERWFENPSLGANGKIDLIRAPDELVDYKSSSKRSARQIVNRAAIDPPADTPNCQAIMYLAHYRSVRPETPLRFTFVHFLETLDDAIVDEADVDEMLTTVEYYPFTFDEYVASREAFDVLVEGYRDCRETFEALGFEAYERIMREGSFPGTTDREELRASDFAERFEAAVSAGAPDDVDAAKGADQAIRALNGVRLSTFFKEDLDDFEGFLSDTLEEVNRLRAGGDRFPIEGPGGDPNYRRVDHRDLLLGGEGDD